ncbi:PAS domain-containing sensor histidine kinase [Methanolobus sp. ZRKC3]|uniref:sensor histidine kinase n=1 Tax=Methanolobus sp. ZRKC3 TaxID=3125786 RepID=UPI00324B0244
MFKSIYSDFDRFSTEPDFEKIKIIPLSEYREMLDKTLKELIKQNQPYNIQFKIKRENDGQIRDIHSIARYYKERNVIIGTIQDITKLKQAENALLHAKLLAEAANRSKDEFLATMSHELRTPLTSVIGFSDILLDETFGSLNDKQSKYVSHILKGGKYLLKLINDILDLSKIEAGEMELYYETFSVFEAVNEVWLMTKPLAMKKSIDINVAVGPGLEYIKGDKIKFKQILYNLVSNAIKFTDNKGTVKINAQLTDSMVQISVKDEGIGIPKEDISKLFQPFKQLNPYTTRKYEGTGLGLALVKKFVEMHDGSIWVESDVGKGSNFTFTVKCE